MGRPSKLTPGIQKAICRSIAEGNYPEVAAAAAGVHRATFFRWLARGKKARRGPFRDFCDAIKKAQAQAEANQVGTIKRAARKSWTAVAWLLERRHPERWAKREREQWAKLRAQIRQVEKRLEQVRA